MSRSDVVCGATVLVRSATVRALRQSGDVSGGAGRLLDGSDLASVEDHGGPGLLPGDAISRDGPEQDEEAGHPHEKREEHEREDRRVHAEPRAVADSATILTTMFSRVAFE